MACSLQGLSHHSLVLRAATSTLVRKNLSVRRHKTSEQLSVFIVDGSYLIRTKMTHLLNHRSIIVPMIVMAIMIIRSHLRLSFLNCFLIFIALSRSGFAGLGNNSGKGES